MSFIIILTLALSIHVSQAQYLAPHNAARAKVNVGPLVWNNNLAAYARNYANQRAGDCNLIHSGGPYGENCNELRLSQSSRCYKNVGFASVTCNTGGTFVICNYDPPGNWRGQRPYQTYDAIPSNSTGSISNI
ncbi:hypothetical protein MKX01_000548 [Papaver californicum]|nr:hypothetical protein MKX01_000548 [Papaver californicum]